MDLQFFKTRFILPLIVVVPGLIAAGCGSSSKVPNLNEPEEALRVFVYNIHHGRGMDGEVNIERIADLIREKDPHLVALNEVDVGVERSGSIDIMELLAESLEMEPVFGKNLDHEGGEYGNGILTRLPVNSSGNLHLKQAEEGEQRGLLQAEVEYNGGNFVFMTTHLDHQSDRNRHFAVEQIIETTHQYSGKHVIVVGDFNATPGDPVIDQMKTIFTDAWEEKGDGHGYTIPVPASKADRRIDYVFYSNNEPEEGEAYLQAVHMEVINSEASDHLPVYAVFEVVEE